MSDVSTLWTADPVQRPSLLPAAKEVGVSVELVLNGKSYLCTDNQAMILGRADHCDVLDLSPWVSREHAILEVKGDKVNLTDRSSGSTYVKIGDGHEVSIVRESIMLSGSGIISLVLSTEAPNVNPIQFRMIYG